MRSIWKGFMRFSLVSIPIRIYNAVETAETIRFNQLHRGCNGRIGYDKKCKRCQQVLETKEIVKGYEYEPDQYVIIEEDDFGKVKLKSTRVIEIEGFIDAKEVHPTMYESPYYAGPDGSVAVKAYKLLSDVLMQQNKVGVGRVVLRDREDVVLIAPQNDALVLYKLRHPHEIRKMTGIPQIEETVKIDQAEMALARQLVETMSKHVGDIDMSNRYHDALLEMIDAKVKGQDVVTAIEEEKPVVDIMTALKQSLEQAKESRKPMVTAKGKEATLEPEAKPEETRAKGRKKKVA
jgi:DNA end-binding protein Ku